MGLGVQDECKSLHFSQTYRTSDDPSHCKPWNWGSRDGQCPRLSDEEHPGSSACLLCTVEQDSGVVPYRWTVRQGCYYDTTEQGGRSANLGTSSLCRRAASIHKHGGERFYSGCFLHILSKSEHGPEGRFAVPLNLTQERICFSHGSKAPGSLAWLCAGQTGIIQSGFHWLPITCHSIFT